MKRYVHIGVLITFVFIGLMSCQKYDGGSDRRKGGLIKFGASTGYANAPATRTEYSGLDENGGSIVSTSNYERIDWVAGSDRIRILCAAAGNGPTADYAIAGTPTASGAKSSAGITPVAESGLQWGTGDHYFYAMYPAPGMSSNYGFTDNNPVLESTARLEAASGNMATLTGVIPAEQEAFLPEGGREFKANMNYAYMYAATKVNARLGQGGEVALAFKPLATTIEFTFLTPADDAISRLLTSVTLTSSTCPLAGSFAAVLSCEGGAPEVTVQNPVNEITVTLPDRGVRLNSSFPYKVTLLALPVDLTDLTLTLIFTGGVRRTLELKNNGDFITVPAGKKVYIRSLGVPGSTWNYDIGELKPVTLGYTGGSNRFSNTLTFKSIRSKGSVTEAVPYKLQYSEDDGLTWTDGLPEWLEAVSPSSFAGSTGGEELTLTMSPQVNTAPDDHHAALAAMPAKSDFDLSTFNPSTGVESESRNTANSYVVRAPGTYRIPLVYGNAIKDGEVNDGAFHRQQNLYTGKKYPEYLFDHNDEQITNSGSPGNNCVTNSIYIAERFSDKPLSATLVWQDMPALVTDIGITGSGRDAFLTFNVPAESIYQGNAILALLVDGVIAWSWHVWVTDEDLTVTVAGGDSYSFAPVNIGWSDILFPARSCMVRAVQDVQGGDVSAAVMVVQEEMKGGNCPYFQWGRKDPLVPSDGLGDNDKTVYPVYVPVFGQNSRVSVGAAIRTPHIHYCSSSEWRSQVYHNLWNTSVGHLDQTSTPVSKTIYDPSPAGFSIPPQSAFNGLTGGGEWHRYPRSHYSHYGFPASGYRIWDTGAVRNVYDYGYYWTSCPYRRNDLYSWAWRWRGNTSPTLSDYFYTPTGIPVRPIVNH